MLTKLLFPVVLSWLFITAAYTAQFNLTSAAKDVTTEVARVGKIRDRNTANPVFVIEEYHTSRVGQIQISIVLNRLYIKYGVRQIGLEGFTRTGATLDTSWFHRAGGPNVQQAREDVAVRMLAEGEINAAEFMSLIYQDYKIFGVEKQSEYKVELDIETSPRFIYLISIAEKTLSQSQIREANKLVEKEKMKEVIDLLMNSDPWVKKQYKEITSPSSMSTEIIAKQIRDIQKKAKSLGVRVDPQVKQDMIKTLNFFEMASQRSETMVDSLLMISRSNAPIVLIVGAAHTERVLTELESRRIGYAVITPIALNPDKGNLSIEQFKRKNNRLWARIKPGTLGSILNHHRKPPPILETRAAHSYASMNLLNHHRKPPPILETRAAHSYASMNLASILIAEAARSGKSVPNDIWDQLRTLPAIRIDRDSFSKDGDDVIFRAYLIDTDNTEKIVWARVGILNTAEATSLKKKSLEQKLLQAAADLSEEPVSDPARGEKIPPQDPPPGTKRTSNEGPGDGKRGDILVTKLNRRTIVVYTKGRDEAIKVGRISG